MATRRRIQSLPTGRNYFVYFIICTLFFLNLFTFYSLLFKKPGEAVGECPDSNTWIRNLIRQATFSPISGHRNSEKKYLTIGIPTVYRNERYLRQTLTSLIQESTPEEKANTVIVIYLADVNSTLKARQRKLVEMNFLPYLKSGFLRIIASTPDIYPSFDFPKAKRFNSDSVELIRWKSKQVIDLVFLLSYAQNISEYYLMVADDIIAARQYVGGIRHFIETHHDWVALEFSELAGIGRLFRNKDLPDLVDILMMFHLYRPVDLLIQQFIIFQFPNNTTPVRKRVPALFQHIGKTPTFPNKLRLQTDSTFGIADRKYKNQNPPANLFTSMTVYDHLIPTYAYKQTPGYFWGILKRQNEIFDIVFNEPLNFSRVVIITGIQETQKGKSTLKDTIIDGTLEMGVKCEIDVKTCEEYSQIGVFKENRSGILDVDRSLVNVLNLRIKIGGAQRSWVIIREIEIFLDHQINEEKKK